MERLLALALLAAAGGPAAPRRQLLAACGDRPGAIVDPAAHRACGLTPAQSTALRRPAPDVLDRLERWLAAPGHALIGVDDPDWPPAFARLSSPPVALFVEGDPALLWRPAVAVVGSRGATPVGRQHAAEFARALARAGFVVGSGLAAGIDAAAHAAALDVDGATFAVLGTGTDIAYPAAHAGLHREIAARGALVSEHPPGTGPRREHFPSRNRLLAALCVGTVVIEAAERSGALITARLAADAGREVFAMPGSVRNPQARGCHRLIREGATLVETPAEVVEALAGAAALDAREALARLGPSGPGDAATATEPAVEPPAPDHDILWRALGHDPTDMDELAERTGLTLPELSPMLLAMELDGRVVRQHGRYLRLG